MKKEGYEDSLINKKTDVAGDKVYVYQWMGPCVTNYWNVNNQICVCPGPNLLNTIKNFAPDIVHIFFPTIIGYILFPYIRKYKIPIYASHHVDMVYYIN